MVSGQGGDLETVTPPERPKLEPLPKPLPDLKPFPTNP
jgi:hypothetical protein